MGREIEKIALNGDTRSPASSMLNNPEKFDSPEFRSADVAIEFTFPRAPCITTERLFAANIPGSIRNNRMVGGWMR